MAQVKAWWTELSKVVKWTVYMGGVAVAVLVFVFTAGLEMGTVGQRYIILPVVADSLGVRVTGHDGDIVEAKAYTDARFQRADTYSKANNTLLGQVICELRTANNNGVIPENCDTRVLQ